MDATKTVSLSSFLSSDRDSLSSSTDREDDPSSGETSEVRAYDHLHVVTSENTQKHIHTDAVSLVCDQELKEPDDILRTTPVCDPPDTELPESKPEVDVRPTQICSRRHKVRAHWLLKNIYCVCLCFN